MCPLPVLGEGRSDPAPPRRSAGGLEALWVVRHGQSVANLARDAAEAEGRDVIDIEVRDADVELSELGRRQAEALGGSLLEHLSGQPPTAVISSPYARSRDTAHLALQAAGLPLPVRLDERLRDRDFGVLDRLTWRGIQDRFPDEAERRRRHGKFLHRPAGGESWADVALRLRSLLTDLRLTAEGERVLLFAHDIVVLLLRYLVEELTEPEVLALQRGGALHNGGLTGFTRDPATGGLALQLWNLPCGV